MCALFTEENVKVLSALLTPLIAVMAVYIAYQQYKLAEAKARREAYQDRMEVFKAVMAYIDLVNKTAGDIKDETIRTFAREVVPVNFLFPEEIISYIVELVNKAWDLQSAVQQFRDTSVQGEAREKAAADQRDLSSWFAKQHVGAIERFKPHLTN